MSAPLILIAEDEMALGELLSFHLKEAGFQTEVVGDGRLALLRLHKEPAPAVLLLDWMMPGPSGLNICKRVRFDSALSKMPILMLTARGGEEDVVAGLEAGADDYLTKPFSTKELIARLRALLRRTQTDAPTQTNALDFGALRIERENYRVLWNKKILPLSPTSFNLLSVLAEHPNKVMTREQLLNSVWGTQTSVEPRTIDANIKRLRTLLKENTKKEFIKTSHGFGYFFEPPL